MQKLKIGVVIDDLGMNVNVAQFNAWATRQEKVELTAIFVTRSSTRRSEVPKLTGEKTGYRTRPVSELAFGAALKGEKFLLRFFSKKKRSLCEDYLNGAGPEPDADVQASPSIPTVQFHAIDGFAPAQRLIADGFELDLLVNFSSTALPRSVAEVARLGALRIDYKQDRLTANAPVGFWEPYYRTPSTKFSINSLAKENDKEEIILEGSFRTQFSFLLNQAYLYRKSLAQLQQVILTAASNGTLPYSRKIIPHNGSHLAEPDLHETISYLAKLLARMSTKAIRRAMNIKEKWGIQVIQSSWQDVSSLRARRIQAPSGHFWADPFLRTCNGRTYCFIEDYVYSENRAHISVLEFSGDKTLFLGTALKEDFHLSFPFIFEYRGQTYMCPEASESNQIRVYRSTSFPLQWELCSIPMDNISAADSMFFEHGGKWWLLTSVDRSGLNDHCSELCLFYADSPLEQGWTPHPRNPIYVDTEGGRNAGLILEGRKILRAAQNQGFDRYGESLSIYEIVTLDEQDYHEVKVTDFKHMRANHSLASHHISTTGNITVFDFLTRRFAP